MRPKEFLVEIFSGMLKDVTKKGIGIGFLILLGIFLWYLDFPLPPSIRENFDAAKNGYDFVRAYAWDNQGSFLAVQIAGWIILFLLVLHTRHKLRSNLQLLADASTYKVLLDEVGLAGRWPHARVGHEADGNGASWSEIAADISRPDNTFVLILGANGEDTFGKKGSPLYEVLENFHRSIRVVLLAPDSDETKARAAALASDARAYKASIHLSVRRLAELVKKSRPVEGRYYSGQPNWKMIITNKTAWIQYYATSGKHIADTPVYMFYNSISEYNFYSIFYAEFERIWRRCDRPMKLR